MSAAPETPARLRSLSVLVLIQLLVAAAGLVVEILAGRMLAPYVGMSLYTWTAIIAVVLAGFSAGHWVGGIIAERPTAQALALTAVSMALAALFTAAALPLLRMSAGAVVGGMASAGAAIITLSVIVTFMPSFFAGIPAPVLAKVAVDEKPDAAGRALGAMFAASSVGAIAGTLAAGFVFIAWLGTSITLCLVAALYAFLAVLLHIASGEGRSWIASAAACTVAALLCIYNLIAASPCTKESRYYCIRIIDFRQQAGADAKLMVLDHLGHGINVADEPKRLLTPYVALMDQVLRKRLAGAPESSFFIGGGAYTLPRAWRAWSPEAKITVAEVDPDVTLAATGQMWVQRDAFTVLHEDARRALAIRPDRYRVIVGDAFTDIAVPAHLVTREFFQLVQSRLEPGGVYAMNVVDHAESLDALAAIYRTLKSVFETVEVFAEAGDVSSGGRTTFVLFASDKPSGIRRLIDEQDDDRLFARLTAKRLDRRIEDGRAVLLTDDHAPIDRLVGIGEL